VISTHCRDTGRGEEILTQRETFHNPNPKGKHSALPTQRETIHIPNPKGNLLLSQPKRENFLLSQPAEEVQRPNSSLISSMDTVSVLFLNKAVKRNTDDLLVLFVQLGLSEFASLEQCIFVNILL